MIIGIDPGLTGAIAFLTNSPENKLTVYDLPLDINALKGIKEISAHALYGIIKTHTRNTDPADILVVIEDVHSMPGQGVASTFTFGFNTGIIHGCLQVMGFNAIRKSPAVWKSSLGLGRNKKDSISLAKKTFPEYKKYFKRAKDDGRAEAALLAYIGQKHLSLITDTVTDIFS